MHWCKSKRFCSVGKRSEVHLVDQFALRSKRKCTIGYLNYVTRGLVDLKSIKVSKPVVENEQECLYCSIEFSAKQRHSHFLLSHLTSVEQITFHKTKIWHFTQTDISHSWLTKIPVTSVTLAKVSKFNCSIFVTFK